MVWLPNCSLSSLRTLACSECAPNWPWYSTNTPVLSRSFTSNAVELVTLSFCQSAPAVSCWPSASWMSPCTLAVSRRVSKLLAKVRVPPAAK
ncbi:hypothetical protein D9M71_792630 [compost metagenome]